MPVSPPVLRGKRVGVVGLARSGVAAAKLCAREGAEVTVTDARGADALGPALAALDGVPVRRALGGHGEAFLDRQDLLVVSPGVPLGILPLADARAKGVPIWGEVELAYRFLRGTPLVAITGTNGKSTTTALTGALLAGDRPTFTGGNLGTPLCEHVLSGKRADVVVAELSSFQLEGIDQLRANAAAFLNLTPDHLDRYASVDAYALAKGRLFARQQPGDVAVANARDPLALGLAAASRGRLLTFGFGPPAADAARDAAPDAAEGTLVVSLGGAEERYRLRNRALRGRHNRENAMAAILLARAAGAPPAAVQAGLDAFPGLPHRLELVSDRGGVEWVNDSKATNVDSTSVALAAFAPGAPRLVVLMGGRGKGAPYAPLRELFPGRVKALLTLGEDAPAVERELGDLAPTHACGTLAAAVKAAARLVAPGDVVLLSPACASYDQFDNYEQRGAAFRALVEGLK
ncbi:MAG: UDP-N-acetylmuramoyl-L-alanine--D-glutamate ligase [Anaeromyxobacter sp.]